MYITKKFSAAVLFFLLFAGKAVAQKLAYTEYDLDNGLHVILHQDKTAPVVAVTVFYHVGSKNEEVGRTGFAHFLNIFYLKEQTISNVGNGRK